MLIRLSNFVHLYKNFDEKSFLDDLFNVSWINVKKCDNADDALQLWQCVFNDVIDKHIPKKSKCVRAVYSDAIKKYE